jgi:hypothetical protein
MQSSSSSTQFHSAAPTDGQDPQTDAETVGNGLLVGAVLNIFSPSLLLLSFCLSSSYRPPFRLFLSLLREAHETPNMNSARNSWLLGQQQVGTRQIASVWVAMMDQTVLHLLRHLKAAFTPILEATNEFKFADQVQVVLRQIEY